MSQPIAVFDAGIGSYAIVDLIRRRQPGRDIVYFADRARFPYGEKGRDELLSIMQGTVRFLLNYEPQAIVVASNAPSIMVLDAVKETCPVPVFGVAPPLAEAVARSLSGEVGIMGVRSLVESRELACFVRDHVPDPGRVALINGSSMVELVESGAFLSEPERTQRAVAGFLAEIAVQYPAIDVLTLSSTHLPWLRPFFERVRSDWSFLDPAESVVAALPAPQSGSGCTLALVSESRNYDVAGFRRMLEKLGIDLVLTVVDPDIA
ncbi:aspartate/glutamate racemase family protein [Mesorhizobium sp. 1M-11]|uniref:glutamate racemase n=1 Tax=Mesorhizobium sp. 1M-11 TaxID=1529006 RepID=UPI0009E7D261|nr:aspartate/glutamate racemase family protein [Mesorhizobium sp. 1M-11]